MDFLFVRSGYIVNTIIIIISGMQHVFTNMHVAMVIVLTLLMKPVLEKIRVVMGITMSLRTILVRVNRHALLLQVAILNMARIREIKHVLLQRGKKIT